MAAPVRKMLFGPAVIIPKENGQTFRKVLEKHQLWDKSRKLKTLGNEVAIPVIGKSETESVLLDNSTLRARDGTVIKFIIEEMNLPASRKSLLKTPFDLIVDQVKNLAEECGMELSGTQIQTIPQHWEVHGDLLLLPVDGFSPPHQWDILGDKLWRSIVACVGCQRVARKKVIKKDGYRSPQVELLLGEDGWVQHLDNGIKYRYDVTKCMFSIGNITEKLRIARFDCTGETVVDLYAGIGYFTLPYLVHAKAGLVHACEWNPDAVSALEKNLRLNSVQDRCIVHLGDNRQVCPKGMADRVNLGLIPSSEEGWPVACAALRADRGGILHIHNNLTAYNKYKVDLTDYSNHTEGKTIQDVLWSECLGTEATVTDADEKADRSVLDLKGDQALAMSSARKDPLYSNCTDVGTGMCEKAVHQYWQSWARETETVITRLLTACHRGQWRTRVLHIEHVKSYAPHVDHLVLDLECRPMSRTKNESFI